MSHGPTILLRPCLAESRSDPKLEAFSTAIFLLNILNNFYQAIVSQHEHQSLFPSIGRPLYLRA